MLFLFFSWFTGGRPPWDTQQNMVLHLSLLSNLNQRASYLKQGRCLFIRRPFKEWIDCCYQSKNVTICPSPGFLKDWYYKSQEKVTHGLTGPAREQFKISKKKQIRKHVIGNVVYPPLIEYQSKSLVRKKCILVLFTALQDQHFRLQIVLVAFISWFPRRGIWLSSRLGEMKSHVRESGREEKMSKYVATAVKEGREI